LAVLRRKQLIERYTANQITLLDDEGEKRYSRNQLLENSRNFSYLETYDIFLSHSYDDARVIREIRDMLTKKGYSVYVDWLEDEHLDRGKVSQRTANVLRTRMNNCSSLIYITSESAKSSVWMPWELGYMDAKTGRVSVAPILDEDVNFEGQEYLGLYPYLDLTSDNFYIHRNSLEWVNFKGWMEGDNPKSYT